MKDMKGVNKEKVGWNKGDLDMPLKFETSLGCVDKAAIKMLTQLRMYVYGYEKITHNRRVEMKLIVSVIDCIEDQRLFLLQKAHKMSPVAQEAAIICLYMNIGQGDLLLGLARDTTVYDSNVDE